MLMFYKLGVPECLAMISVEQQQQKIFFVCFNILYRYDIGSTCVFYNLGQVVECPSAWCGEACGRRSGATLTSGTYHGRTT